MFSTFGPASTILPYRCRKPPDGAVFSTSAPPRLAEPVSADNDLVIQDMAGHPVYLEGAARKVMIFAPMLWHYVNVDGSDEHVFAIAKFMKKEAQHTLFGKLYPGIATKDEALTSTGAVPLGVEQVLLERPDAVLSWADFATGLENIRYPGLVKLDSDASPANAALYRLFGELAGQSQRVQWLFDRYGRQVDDIRTNVPSGSQPAKIIVLSSDRLYLWGANTAGFNANLRLLNAENVAAGVKRQNGDTNIETLLGFDPEVIFIASYYMSAFFPADVYADPRLRSLRAVKNRRVYRMPAGASRMEGPVELPLLMAWMAELLHPEITPKIRLREMIRQTYQEVYGYAMSEREMDELLQIEHNNISVNYERFARVPT